MKPAILILMCGALALGPAAGVQGAASSNGAGGQMSAYYDHQLFTINLKELSENASEANIDHNASINFIFVSDQPLPNGDMFVSVIDAIQGDGFNPLWVEVEIDFQPGHTPRQLFSDDEIADAAAAGEITLNVTDEVYRCSVVGPKD